MKLKSVRIQNFRAIKDETIELNDYTCFVGPNGAGKSTVLCALNVFFRESADSSLSVTELQEEDFHCKLTTEPIVVTVTFVDLNADAQADFSDYYRQGELIISAEAQFDRNTGRAVVRQYGQRKVIRAFQPFFEALKEKQSVDELKKIYLALKEDYPALPAPGTKAKMETDLRAFEKANPNLTDAVRSEDQFYGVSRGANRLAKYVQWVYVPAVKDASGEQAEAKDTALGRLLARSVRARVSFQSDLTALREDAMKKYQEMLDGQQGTLDTISASLQGRLSRWAHPDVSLTVKWQQDPEKSVRVDEPWAGIVAGEGAFAGNLARLGHGLQRAYLLALLQELSQSSDGDQPKLLLAVEEPELYQHPPQCRHMAQVLSELTAPTAEASAQVLLTSHSPLFVAGDTFESVRLVAKCSTASRSQVQRVVAAEIFRMVADARGESKPKVPERGARAKVHQALQPSLNEIFFSPRIVLVEGREDIAYIQTYMELLGFSERARRASFHIVAGDGKSKLMVPYAILRKLQIPTFLVFDSDGHSKDRNGSREKHRVDNVALLTLGGIESPDPFPSDDYVSDAITMWHSEMTNVVAVSLTDAFGQVKEQVEAEYGHVGHLEKNPIFVADVLERAWSEGLKSRTLIELCKRIMRFCGESDEDVPPNSPLNLACAAHAS